MEPNWEHRSPVYRGIREEGQQQAKSGAMSQCPFIAILIVFSLEKLGSELDQIDGHCFTRLDEVNQTARRLTPLNDLPEKLTRASLRVVRQKIQITNILVNTFPTCI